MNDSPNKVIKNIDVQRLRNLTTGRLHTGMAHIYQDIEWFVGAEGVMTHMLPRARRSLLPFLRKRLPDARYWNDTHDTGHTGEVEVTSLDATERATFWDSFRNAPFP